jgi:hypothetical protein
VAKRLQVLLDEREFREFRRIARAKRMTVADWVRQALRSAGRLEPGGDPTDRIARIRAAAREAFPSGDIDTMLGEIEQGYLGRPRP